MICIPIHSICLNFYTYYFWVSFLFEILQWQKKTSKIIITTSTQTLNFKKIWENRSFSCINISKLIRSKWYIKKKKVSSLFFWETNAESIICSITSMMANMERWEQCTVVKFLKTPVMWQPSVLQSPRPPTVKTKSVTTKNHAFLVQ